MILNTLIISSNLNLHLNYRNIAVNNLTLWHNYYIPYIYREGDDFIQRPTLLPRYNEIGYLLGGRWMPLPAMQVRAMLNGSYKTFTTPAGKERFNAAQLTLQGSYVVRAFQFELTVRTPKRDIDGIMRKYNGWNVSAAAYWQPSAFYAGLSFNYAGQAVWQRIEVEGFSSYNADTDRAMRNYFQLSLGYTFNAGKAKRKSTRAKMLYNEDHESGI